MDYDLSFALVLTDSNISYAEVKSANVTVMRLSPSHSPRLLQELAQSEGKLRVSVVFSNHCNGQSVDCSSISALVQVFAGDTIVILP